MSLKSTFDDSTETCPPFTGVCKDIEFIAVGVVWLLFTGKRGGCSLTPLYPVRGREGLSKPGPDIEYLYYPNLPLPEFNSFMHWFIFSIS